MDTTELETLTEEEFLEEALTDKANEEGHGVSVKTFSAAGLMTDDKGIVVKYKGYKFQLTVVAE